MPVWKCYVGKSWFSVSCHVCWRECKMKDKKECLEDLRGTWTMKHKVSGRESPQRKTTSPGSCPSYRSAIMTTRCSLSHHRKTLAFEFPEHFLNCFYFGALCIFIHLAFYHLCHPCLRNIKSKQPRSRVESRYIVVRSETWRMYYWYYTPYSILHDWFHIFKYIGVLHTNLIVIIQVYSTWLYIHKYDQAMSQMLCLYTVIYVKKCNW